jgi:hypothetical protein
VNPSPRGEEFWTRYRDVVVFLFTVATGASSLGGWTSATTQLVLRTLSFACGAYFIYRMFAHFLTDRAVERSSRAVKCYTEAVERVCDRQVPLYEEKVFVDVVIGRDDAEDKVLEEISTRPTPQLVQRLIRPIAPLHRKGPTRLGDIDLKCEIDDGDDGAIQVTALPVESSRGFLRVWLVFDPALTKPATWRLQYRPAGLWRPLREKNRDVLIWHDRVPYDGRSPMIDFRVRFRFLDPDFRPGVVERNNLGAIVSTDRGSDGEWCVVWHDPNPCGHRYHWDLTRSPLNGRR